VKLDFIVVAQRDGDTALGVFGRRLAQRILGDHQHLAGRGGRGAQFDCGAQAGNSGSDHQKIRTQLRRN
jgi:hypothetical protein